HTRMPREAASGVLALARAAADRHAAEANAAHAAGLQALGQAVAASLHHAGTVLVAAGAVDFHAVGRVGALAVAHGETALAHLNAVHQTAAAAQAVAQHAAHVLQRGGHGFVFTGAADLRPAGDLFELDIT